VEAGSVQVCALRPRRRPAVLRTRMIAGTRPREKAPIASRASRGRARAVACGRPSPTPVQRKALMFVAELAASRARPGSGSQHPRAVRGGRRHLVVSVDRDQHGARDDHDLGPVRSLHRARVRAGLHAARRPGSCPAERHGPGSGAVPMSLFSAGPRLGRRGGAE
jgi:hypothetical protein